MSQLVPRSVWDLPSLSPFGGDDWFQRASGVNIAEDDSHVTVQLAVPGIDPAQLEATFHQGMLHVRTVADKTDTPEGGARNAISYRVSVPGEFDESAEPEARVDNGLLKVAFRKAEQVQPKKIAIKKG